MKPILNYVPIDKQPVLNGATDKKWSFSFRYWNQIDFFGLNKSDTKWFVSLLEKLKDLSEKDLNKFLSDGCEQNAWRYHSINWNQKNIPLQRKDFNWIDSDILDNEDEFPIVQFQISKSLGRIVGFWDENSVFNIVLLDPLHNIQPSKSHNYRVDYCSPLSCSYTSLLYDIDQIKKSSKCDDNKCDYKVKIDTLPTNSNYVNIIMHYLDDDSFTDIKNIIDSDKAKDATEILRYGIMFCQDKLK